MRKIAATYVFCGNHTFLKNGIVVCENDGTILEIRETTGNIREEPGLEYYSGILVPGFVNVHCHLELSHLKGKIEEKTGIGGFVAKINPLRNTETESRDKAMAAADRKMWAAGIAAVGDISNSTQSIPVKLKSKIVYHTFVESFGFHPSRAEKSFEYSLSVKQEFSQNGLKNSLVPHSPYSVSKLLFQKIKEQAQKDKGILSIHNQESKAESEFYRTGGGAIANHLQNNLGIDISHWQPTGQSSLQSVLTNFPVENQLILVHNTFTGKQDLDFVFSERKPENTFFALCPNSNLYIENQLPPVNLFRNENLNLCIGTDSLASNHELSVLEEIKMLQQNFPGIKLDELLTWSTLNGAKALGIENRFGSFDPGKKPGINLVSGIDFKTMKFTALAKVRRLA